MEDEPVRVPDLPRKQWESYGLGFRLLRLPPYASVAHANWYTLLGLDPRPLQVRILSDAPSCPCDSCKLAQLLG